MLKINQYMNAQWSFTAIFLILISSLNCQRVMALGSDIDLTQEIYEPDKYWLRTYAPPPRYPLEAMKQTLGGCATFVFIISQDGYAEEIETYHTSPRRIFEEEARRALEQYRWSQTYENKASQRVKTSIKISFEVEGGSRNVGVWCDTPEQIESSKMPDPISTPVIRERKQCPPDKSSRLLRKCD